MHHKRCISPFNLRDSQQNTKKKIWIQTSILWLFVCSYLAARRGNWASLKQYYIRCSRPAGPLFNTRANTTLTSQQDITRRSHKEERRRGGEAFLQHNISSTQHVQHAHNLRCVRQDQASTNQKISQAYLSQRKSLQAYLSQSLAAKVSSTGAVIRTDLSRPGLWTGCWWCRTGIDLQNSDPGRRQQL